MKTFLSEKYAPYLAIAIFLCLIFYLSLTQRQRDVVVSRLRLRRRRPLSAETPPRSISPEKEVPSNLTSTPNEYVTQFPPSQRAVLHELAKSLPSEQRNELGNLDFDQE